MLSFDDLTLGCELEWADVDRRIPIPEHLGEWNFADYTIVNSNGHANDPLGNYPFGGEINTRPSTTAQQQATIVEELRDLLRPTINYRCNLHVHVGIGDLADDLDTLKALATYFREQEAFVYRFVEPIPKPSRYEYKTRPEYDGAMKRYKRRLVSHHYRLPDQRFAALMAATSTDEFYKAHAPYNSAKNRHYFHIAPRAGMNLRSIHKHRTIEFRHFPGTADSVEIESACSWVKSFVYAGITDQRPAHAIFGERLWSFPTFRKYDHDLELSYQATKYKT